MAKILVYNHNIDRFETFARGEEEPMPYNTGGSLLVREFRGASESPTLWTTRRVMEAWNIQRRSWGSPINVGYAFRRPWEGGHSARSQHYAGTAFDCAQGWSNLRRAALRLNARAIGVWSYIEPVSISPTWVHFDRRQSPPACPAGYPTLQFGSVSVYVLILQDGLNTIGFPTGALDGVFGSATHAAVMRFQELLGLAPDGIAGCSTWTALQFAIVGNGRSGTTVD